VCPTEICNFSDASGEFEKIGAQIVGCSIDSHFTHMEYTKKPRAEGGLGKMNIPMVSDLTKSIAKSYGALIEEGGDNGVAFRATYIIDRSGILRHASISDLPVGRNVDEVLRLVQAFMYTDEHGEVCPSGWKPGQATMVPDHASKKLNDFWANEHGKK
jgi:alkyl hydroperoxide reductase subunit AhpC